jgi:hypothetical protein
MRPRCRSGCLYRGLAKEIANEGLSERKKISGREGGLAPAAWHRVHIDHPAGASPPSRPLIFFNIHSMPGSGGKPTFLTTILLLYTRRAICAELFDLKPPRNDHARELISGYD